MVHFACCNTISSIRKLFVYVFPAMLFIRVRILKKLLELECGQNVRDFYAEGLELGLL